MWYIVWICCLLVAFSCSPWSSIATSTASTAQSTANTADNNAISGEHALHLVLFVQHSSYMSSCSSAFLCAALTSGNNAGSTANTAYNTAGTAQSTANAANGKTCYLANSYYNGWGSCPFGGSYGGGVSYAAAVAGYSSQEVWHSAQYHWVCCT